MGDQLIASAKRRGQGRQRASENNLVENVEAGSVSLDSESETDIPLEENMSALSLDEAQSQKTEPSEAPTSETATWGRSRKIGKGQKQEKETAPTASAKRSKKKDIRRAREHEAAGGGDAFDMESEIGVEHRVHRHERELNLQYISLRDLEHQSKIERDPHHGQFQSTVHRCHKPLHEMKIRVQLLQYSPLMAKKDHSDRDEKLAILEERIFSWQEKVFSEAEAHFYHDKKNLSSELDFAYHERLRDHPDAVGYYLYSNTQADKAFISKKSDQKATVRRCAAIHPGQASMDLHLRVKRMTGSDSESDFETEVRDYGDIISPTKVFSIFGRTTEVAGARGRQPVAAEHRKAETETEKVDKSGSESESGQDETEKTSEHRPTKVTRRQRAADSAVKTSARYNLRLFGKDSIWNPDKCDFRVPNKQISKIAKPQQVMYIMASLPMQNKKRKKMVVGSIRAYPRAGVILIKPSFGYRNVELQNHRYRIAWELYPAQVRTEPEDNFLQQEPQRIGAGGLYAHRFIDSVRSRVTSKEAGQHPASLMDHVADIFEMVPSNEFRVQIMGEILSAVGFENSPIAIHYYLELPKGWRNEGEHGSLGGVTHSAQVNTNGVAHFSQDFCFQLAFSMDSVDESETYPTPVLYLMATCIEPKVVINYEGYAYLPIPSQPGFHSIDVNTWKARPSSVVERLDDAFVNISPALKGAHAVHGRTHENEECRRLNRLGLQTISSGSIQLRFHIIHHSASINTDQRERLQLLEKMSSATILKSVQTVIEAFQRARKKASNVTTSNTLF